MKVPINQLHTNVNNPRVIKNDKFKKLVESIKEFPEMLNLRPIVVDEDMTILGGNMRHKACIEAGLKEVPIKIAKGLTEDQKLEFIIKDNASFGEWDWSMLGNEWDNIKLGEWGLDVWQPEQEVDYGVLNDLDLDDELEDMEDNVKKGILIDFTSEDIEEARELLAKFRKANAYIGGLLIEKLKETKICTK
tara:strand:+ start:2524 stop:3096 length:573 start_codon:yes stop_codon:yes gene_type:complete